MPPGRDSKYDQKSEKSSFFNQLTRFVSLDDPRMRIKQLQSEDIPLLSMQKQELSRSHGTHLQQDSNSISSGHPSPLPSCRSFRLGDQLTRFVSLDDPRIRIKQLQSEDIPLLSMQKRELSRSKRAHLLQDYNSNSSGHPSPLPSCRSFSHSPALSQRSCTTTLTEDSNSSKLDECVLKLCCMFPTVDESHVRALLIKYHHREALVISALQVEKQPFCTPGPHTPPPLRLRRANLAPLSTSRVNSPAASPKPTGPATSGIWRTPNSPKMKLRYLKSVFPVVDDTTLLEILSASDNNVNSATDSLLARGYVKFSKTLPNVAQKPPLVIVTTGEEEKENSDVQRMKTPEEKDAMKSRLQLQFPKIPDRVINLALEVVDYRESMACHILENSAGSKKKCELEETNNTSSGPDTVNDIVEDNVIDTCHSNVIIPPPFRPAALIPSPNREIRKSTVITVCSGPPSQTKRTKGKSTPKVSRGTCTAEDKNYKSSLVKSPQGPNPELPQGPQDQHILPGYVPWNGPNKDLLCGPSIKANGPNRLLLGLRTIFAKGPNKSLAKGPHLGLAKGSIYSQTQEPIHCH